MKRLYPQRQLPDKRPGTSTGVASPLAAMTGFRSHFLRRLLLVLLTGLVCGKAAAAPPADNCSFRTYTQSANGYGTNSNGNSLSTYMEAHFPAAFPAGVSVGCASGYTLKLTSLAAITDFLPSGSAALQALPGNYLNPTKPKGNGKSNDANAYGNAFAGEVVALTLSVGFDLADASFSSASTLLRDAVITSGTFTGKTVAFVLAQANLALGGCSSQYSLQELSTIVTAINEAYDAGKAGTLLSCPPVCNVGLPVAAAVTYCQGAAANPLSSSVTLSSGAALRLYASATATAPLATDFRPSTTTPGSTTYYAAQVVGSCESGRTPLVVTVSNGPAAPVVVSPLPYCVGSAANPLSSSVTAVSGASVQLYTSATGGTPLASDFRPSTTTPGSTTYYASQVVSGCESPRVPLVVTIGTQGAPAVSSAVTYCQGAAAAPLSASVTPASGATLKFYSAATGGTALTSLTPSTATVGSTTYYVSQVAGTCESSRVPLTVTVVNGPTAPAVAAPLTYCLNAPANSLSSSVTPTNGASVQLYTTATGGTPLAADFRPSTAALGTTTYYASQAVSGCESGRTPLDVTVVAAPGTPTIVSSLAIDERNIAAWGDSFTDANYGLYPQVLSQLTGRAVANLGIGGQTSVMIKDRMVADTQKHTWPSIFWVGRNDSGTIEQVKNSIDIMIANLTHTDYLVLSVLNGSGEGIGTSAYDQIMTLNNELARTYGSHYLDVRSFLVSQYDPSNPQDVADHAADIPPSSLRQDFLHPNAKGSTLIANYIYANIGQLLNGGVLIRYCQGAQAAALSTAFNATTAGATLRFYASASATTPLGTGTSYAPLTSAAGTTTYYVAQALGNCESGRVAITVGVTNCAATTAARTTATSLSAPTTAASVASSSALTPDQAAVVPTFTVFPNPFTAQATVSFRLPASQPYTLDLYNSTGRLVQHLAAGTAEAGRPYGYLIDSQTLPSGLYVVRLAAGQNSRTFRLTLSK